MKHHLPKHSTRLLIIFVVGLFLLSGCNNQGEGTDNMVENDKSEEVTNNEVIDIDNDAKAITDEDLLNYLGKTAEEIIMVHGPPDFTDTYQGSVFLHYEDSQVSFYFDFGYYGEDKPFYIDENAPAMAVSSSREGVLSYNLKLGMTFDEIASVIGFMGNQSEDYESDYIMLFYNLKKFTESITDVELRFFAKDDKSPTESVRIIWKGYYANQ